MKGLHSVSNSALKLIYTISKVVALSPFLFIVILDVLTESIGTDPPNAMLFADDLVICEDTRDKAEYQLERWRDVLERHGLKVSRQKTEYMPPSNTNDAIKLGEE